MIKTKKVKKEVVEIEVVDYVCNKCGETCSNAVRYHNAKKPDCCGWSGLNEVEVHGGYDSRFIGDMISWKFSLCEKCISELTKSFKIPHEIKSQYSRDYVSLEKHEKIMKKVEENSIKDYIKAIVRLQKENNLPSNKKELLKKDHNALYDLYQELQGMKRKK